MSPQEVAAHRAHLGEVERWLGLVPVLPPEGLHGPRRGRLVARHTRDDQAREHPGRWHWISDALVATYPLGRERQVMALLHRQHLDDRLWRWIYALMVTGGPLQLSELIDFVARLTGPADVAEAEIRRRALEYYRTVDRQARA